MGIFKKYFLNPVFDWIEKRHSGFALFRNYAPKERDRNEILRKIMNYCAESRLRGDYLEFGVFKGGNFAAAMKWAAKNKKLDNMQFYAFDSFRGLPAIQGKDSEFKQFNQGEYTASLDVFKKTLRLAGLKENKVEIVPGWFNETLNAKTKKTLPLKSAAVVWIDCDLYESTVPVLDFITDYLVDGTILVFDDWYLFRGSPKRGEQLAFSEWLNKNPKLKVSEFHKYSWHGNSFIVHKD